VLLDKVVAKADSAPDPAKDLSLDPPFQKIGGARREVASLSKAAVCDFLQQDEPPTIAQSQDQPQDQPLYQPKDQPKDQPQAQPQAQPH